MKKVYLLLLLLGSLALRAQNALDFDGSNDYIDCGNDTSIQIHGKYITLEAWIYPTAWKTNAYEGNIIAKEFNTSNYGYMLRCGAGGKLNFAIGDGSWHEITTANSVLSLNTWQHVAGTYDGNKMRLYLNGVAIDSLSYTGSIAKTPSNNLYIGAHLTYSRYYQGAIDEVKIWSICKSESEILNAKDDELCNPQNGLRAYYKFNQGKAAQNNLSVKKLNDLSGFANHGTLNNFALSGSGSNWIKGVGLQKASSNATIIADVCDRYLSPSRKFTWTQSGTFLDTIPTWFGCDSALSIQLTIRKPTSYAFSAHACDSFKIPGSNNYWKSSGNYTIKTKNMAGCDSTITVYLKIGGNRDTIYPVVCNAYTVPSGKRTLFVSGQYLDTLVDYRNCDSIVDIRLTVNTNKTSSIQLKGCKQVLSPSGKKIYTASGIYTDTLKTKTGCDSFIQVSVKLLNNSASVTASACNSYTSPDFRNTWTQSGTYYDTMTNVSFCDSVITYHITILKPSFASIEVQNCRFYISQGKKRKWTKSGLYADTLTNYRGCDSILNIKLLIPQTNTAVTRTGKNLVASSPSGEFRWLNCNNNFSFISGATSRNFTAPFIGSFAVEVTDSGCTDTSECLYIDNVSIASIASFNQFKVSPNPNAGSFEIETPVRLKHAVVRITDLKGCVLFECTYEEFEKENLNLSTEPGIYILELIAEAYHAMSLLKVN